MTRILLGMLRAVNVSGYHTTSGAWFSAGHSTAVLPLLDAVIPHGDDVYGATLRQVPTDEFLTPTAFYSDPDHTVVCGPNPLCLADRHRGLLATTHPSNYTTSACQDPATYGYESCDEFLAQTFSPQLTADELLAARVRILPEPGSVTGSLLGAVVLVLLARRRGAG